MDNINTNPLIEKANSLGIIPQEKKVLNGTKDAYSPKTVICVYRDELCFHNDIDEIRDEFGDKVNVIHFHSSVDAFDYLISNSNSVDLVISEILLPDVDGGKLVDASKTFYPWIPFVVYCPWDYERNLYGKHEPDAHIAMYRYSMTELLGTIRTLLGISKTVQSSTSAVHVDKIVQSSDSPAHEDKTVKKLDNATSLAIVVILFLMVGLFTSKSFTDAVSLFISFFWWAVLIYFGIKFFKKLY